MIKVEQVQNQTHRNTVHSKQARKLFGLQNYPFYRHNNTLTFGAWEVALLLFYLH